MLEKRILLRGLHTRARAHLHALACSHKHTHTLTRSHALLIHIHPNAHINTLIHTLTQHTQNLHRPVRIEL